MIKNTAHEKAGDRAPQWPDAIDQFGAYLLEQEKSPNTIRCYRQDLVKFGTWYQAEHQEVPELPTVTAAELRAWKAAMGEHAPQSINRRLAAVQALLKWAEARKWCQPVQRPRTVRQEIPPPRWLTRKEERALVRVVERGRQAAHVALVSVFLNTGLRVAEAASLRWTMLELSPRKGSVTVTGKGRKRRTVPLNVDVRNALVELASGWKIDNDRAVFEGREGGLTANALWRIVVHYGALAGLDDLSPHVLRHTFCKRLAEKGTRLEVIAKLAGHESIETTRRYVEPGDEDLQAAVDGISGGDAD